MCVHMYVCMHTYLRSNSTFFMIPTTILWSESSQNAFYEEVVREIGTFNDISSDFVEQQC